MSKLLTKIGKTVDYHSGRARRGLRGLAWGVGRPLAERPIMVLGCSRAGTTLVYKTLSESSEIGSLQRETHDYWTGLHPLADKNFDTHALDASDASERDRAEVSRYFYSWTGRRRWVDKNNQNGLCVPYLHALFESAHFVYVKRSPGDNLNSLIEGWGRPEEFGTWSGDLPAKVAIDGGRYRRWCFFLADGWRDYTCAPLETVAAFQYRAINEAIIEARSAIPPSQWIEVFYEDFLRNPVDAFRSVFDRCGLAFDSRMERHCRNVLDTPYNAFSPIRLDKWKDGSNRDRVARALPQVVDVASLMGYAAG